VVIGTASYDPARVLYAEVKQYRGKWVLNIAQGVGESDAVDIEIDYDSMDDAIAGLRQVDAATTEARKKESKADKVAFDAIGTAVDDLVDGNDELEECCKIGFKVS